MFYLSLFFLLSYNFLCSGMMVKESVTLNAGTITKEQVFTTGSLPIDVYETLTTEFFTKKPSDYAQLSPEGIDHAYRIATVLALEGKRINPDVYKNSLLKKYKKELWNIGKKIIPAELSEMQSDTEDDTEKKNSITNLNAAQAALQEFTEQYEVSKQRKKKIELIPAKLIKNQKMIETGEKTKSGIDDKLNNN